MREGQDGITQVIRHHWDRRADTFDEETGHGLVSEEQRSAWLDLLSRLSGSPPRRVLDVGCGTGFLALRFAELGHTVTGIDLSPQMIDRARRKAEQANLQIEFRVGNAVATECAGENYDLVVGRHVIWNLPDPGQGVREWLRVLRPGGRLVLIEGKWADNDVAELCHTPAMRRFGWTIRRAAAKLLRRGGQLRKYHQIEAQLPFSGGPTTERLATFLRTNGLREIVVESLMDPRLWGETPQFLRYLVAGTRAAVSEPRA
jgi:ubiquinone/menaquinone biosynthesis C-methylase UbiE